MNVPNFFQLKLKESTVLTDVNIIFTFNYSTTLVNDGQDKVNILQTLTTVPGFLVVLLPASGVVVEYPHL